MRNFWSNERFGIQEQWINPKKENQTLITWKLLFAIFMSNNLVRKQKSLKESICGDQTNNNYEQKVAFIDRHIVI